MAYAKMESTPKQFGRGRFVVSEGVAPSEKILPDEDLPTLFKQEAGANDEFFEVVLLKGTIVSAYQKTNGRYVATYCRGTAGAQVKFLGIATATGLPVTYDTFAAADAAGDPAGYTWIRNATTAIDNTPNLMGETGVDGVAGSLGQTAKPIGVLARDSFRPFEKGDNEGIGFITKGYVEWPLVKIEDVSNNALFDNSDLKVGDFVKPDALGRPVKFIEGLDPEWLRIGQVIAREDLTANASGVAQAATYDYGYLQYMQLPVDAFDASLLRKAYTSTVFGVGGVFGVRANVSGTDGVEWYNEHDGSPAIDEYGVLGAVRVNLINM